MSRFMTDALTRLRQSRFITVALLTGPAVGGGAELCTVADYRIMLQQTSEEQSECGEKNEVEIDHNHVCFIHASLGASPGWGGAYRLQSIVGRSNALRLLGTSMKVKPEQALMMGLVDQVVKVVTQPSMMMTAAADDDSNTAVRHVHSSSFSISSSSSSSSTTTTTRETRETLHDEAMTAGMSAAISFLLPFTQQPYPNAVGDIKQVPNPLAYHYY
jgi:enoyl-CoA hydratase/carnithine racemase